MRTNEYIQTTIYKSVVIAKLTSAWRGLPTAADLQRLQAVIGHGIRPGLISCNQHPLTELVEDADEITDVYIVTLSGHFTGHLMPFLVNSVDALRGCRC